MTRLPACFDRLVLVLLALAATAACSGSGRHVVDPPPLPPLSGDVRPELDSLDLARRVHREVNAERRKRGLEALAWDDKLARVAMGHSYDMRDRGYFEHESPEGTSVDGRYQRAGYQCVVFVSLGSHLTGGENLAEVWRMRGLRAHPDGRKEPYGWQAPDELARQVVQLWLDSPGHRANLLQRAWGNEGVGVAFGPDGRIWVTQNFC